MTDHDEKSTIKEEQVWEVYWLLMVVVCGCSSDRTYNPCAHSYGGYHTAPYSIMQQTYIAMYYLQMYVTNIDGWTSSNISHLVAHGL